MRAALHTHGLESGAAALGVLNYASKATETSAQKGDELMTCSKHGKTPDVCFHPRVHLH